MFTNRGVSQTNMYSFTSTETNGKGILSSKVGLLSYDEAVHAGYTSSYIINNNGYYYNLMSHAGFKTSHGLKLGCILYLNNMVVQPVISLKPSTLETGSGCRS